MKIFSPNTINFTNTGLFPSNTLYPSATLYPQAIENGLISNGDYVINPIECIEHRELGEWYLEVETKIEDFIIQDAICVVVTKEKGEQPFRIRNIEVGETIVFEAWHIGFDTQNYAIELSFVLNQDCQDAIETLLLNTMPSNSPFTAYSDISTLSVHSVENMSVYDALLSIADHYNGVLDFDKWQIRIVSSIGADNGVTLAYGKNIQESEVYENWDNVVTKMKPIGNDGITLSPVWLTADVSYSKPYAKIVRFDTDSVDNLSFVAQMYLDRFKVPQVNYKVKANVVQNISLGDTIHVDALQFEIDATVLSYKFDVNLQRIIEVEFGNYRRTVEGAFDTLKTEVTNTTLEVVDTKGYIRSLIDDEVVTVGTGGDYTNINDALFYLAYKYPRFKQTAYPYLVSSAEILLLSGFVMNEQVIVERINLGFITISSEDAEVTINRSALTTSPSVPSLISVYPAFCAKENAVLPVINVLFNMNSTGDSGERIGFLAYQNSSINISSGCGIKNTSSWAMIVLANSSANAESCIFTNCLNGIVIDNNSKANLQSSNISGGSSSIGSIGIKVSDGSIVNAESCNVSGRFSGILIQGASVLNARYCNANNSAYIGIDASGSSIVNVSFSTAQNCVQIGYNATYSSSIDASGGNASGAGVYGYNVTTGGRISANGSTGTLSQTANIIQNTGIIFK